MSEFSRRSFLFASSGAAAGTFAVSGVLDAAEAGTGNVSPAAATMKPGISWALLGGARDEYDWV